MTRVLVVDDDPQILRALAINLRAHRYDVTTAASGQEALRRAAAEPPDVVILDLGLPDLDGTDVLAGLRGWTDAPVVVLSGRAGSGDKVRALDAGADDYIVKPFGVEELLARLRAVARRAGTGTADDPVVTFGAVTVDLARTLVTRVGEDGREVAVRLTPTEWRLLEAMIRRPGKLLTQGFLLEEVWGPAYVSQSSSLRLYMAQLRRKLEAEPSRPRHLLTEPGMGYRFDPATPAG